MSCRQMARRGFFPNSFAAMRWDGFSRDSNPRQSVEFHQTGTFEGRSIEWATAPRHFFTLVPKQRSYICTTDGAARPQIRTRGPRTWGRGIGHRAITITANPYKIISTELSLQIQSLLCLIDRPPTTMTTTTTTTTMTTMTTKRRRWRRQRWLSMTTVFKNTPEPKKARRDRTVQSGTSWFRHLGKTNIWCRLHKWCFRIKIWSSERHPFADLFIPCVLIAKAFSVSLWHWSKSSVQKRRFVKLGGGIAQGWHWRFSHDSSGFESHLPPKCLTKIFKNSALKKRNAKETKRLLS